MLHVDKKVLHAQFSRNSLEIHSKLVHLYLENLNAIAVQAAIVADLGFGAVHEMDFPKSSIPGSNSFSYIFYFFALGSFVTSMLSLSQSTLCVVFGHTMFLYGENHGDSLIAIKRIRIHQVEAGFWGAVCACSLLLQACMWTWGSVSNMYIGLLITGVYAVGMYIIYTNSIDTIREFTPKRELKELGPATYLAAQNIATFLGVRGEDEGDEMKGITSDPDSKASADDIRNKIKRKRIRGYLWTKNVSIDDTDVMFTRVYASIENGTLNFYRSKEDYIDLNDPMNDKSFRLRNYVLATSPKDLEKYNPPVTTPGLSMLRSFYTGTHEMSTTDYISAGFNVEYALNRLRFTLAPKSSSELLALDPIQLLAEDDMSFKQWTTIVKDVCRLYQKLRTAQDDDISKRNIADVKSSLKHAHSVPVVAV